MKADTGSTSSAGERSQEKKKQEETIKLCERNLKARLEKNAEALSCHSSMLAGSNLESVHRITHVYASRPLTQNARTNISGGGTLAGRQLHKRGGTSDTSEMRRAYSEIKRTKQKKEGEEVNRPFLPQHHFLLCTALETFGSIIDLESLASARVTTHSLLLLVV